MSIIDLAYTLTAPVEAAMFFMMFDAFFEKRKSFAIWQYVFGLLVLTITIQLANTYLMYNLNNAIGMILVAFIVSLYFYKGQLHKKFFLALSIWVIMAGFEIIVLNVIGLCFKITAYEIVNIPAYLVLGVVVSKGSAFGVCYAIRVRSNLKQIELGWTYWFIFVVLFSTSILASFMIYWMLYTLDDSKYNSPAMFSSLGLYVTTFLALYLYQRSARQTQIIHRQEQSEQQMRQQLKHLDEIILRQNELRRIRHDINGHFTALKGYLDAEDISNARRYLADLSEEFHAAAPSIHTGNNALDAILSAKQSLAASKNITLTTKIRIQRALPIDPRDLCIIFGNALDNAIEACDRLSEQTEKSIDLLLMEETGTLYCQITNTAPPRCNAVFTTSKADSINHGFGLDNIRDALEKYNANLNISQNATLFTLEFLIFF